MGRRSSGKRKRGKASRGATRSRQGEPSVSKLAAGFGGMHSKRRERREEERQNKMDQKMLSKDPTEGQIEATSSEGPLDKAPHSFVFHRGKVGRYALTLVRDIRKVMEPFTASKLKVQKRNNLKDFVMNAGPLHVSHMVVVTRSELSLNLRIIRVPQGPTLTFRINQYSLARHVLGAQRRPVTYKQQFMHQPLLVMNNFAEQSRHVQLMKSMFQHMFPSINIDKLDLNSVKRCVMINYDSEANTVQLRHYAIKTAPAGVSKSLKKLVSNRSLTKKVPNLAKYADISEYLLDPGQLSESEGEQEEPAVVPLVQDLTSRGCKTKGVDNVSVRLHELGPRLTLELIKIEEGIGEGEVLYHSQVIKSQSELARLRADLPRVKNQRRRREKAEQHRVIAKLKDVEERREHREALSRRQRDEIADQTGNDLGEIDDDREQQRNNATADATDKTKQTAMQETRRPPKRHSTSTSFHGREGKKTSRPG